MTFLFSVPKPNEAAGFSCSPGDVYIACRFHHIELLGISQRAAAARTLQRAVGHTKQPKSCTGREIIIIIIGFRGQEKGTVFVSHLWTPDPRRDKPSNKEHS